jgi:hypothetical protein
VLSSPQKIEGFNHLDCQSAMLTDNNFVLVSFSKKQQQHLIKAKMKKNIKKRKHTEVRSCFLDVDTEDHAFHDVGCRFVIHSFYYVKIHSFYS